MKKLNSKQQKDLDNIMKQVCLTLVSTMKIIGANNFITCSFMNEDKTEKYTLKFEKENKT